MPFESPIVYFTPPVWVKQIILQLTVLGHGLNNNLYSGSLIGSSTEVIPITFLIGIWIIIVFSIGFILLGILIFQKKLNFNIFLFFIERLSLLDPNH